VTVKRNGSNQTHAAAKEREKSNEKKRMASTLPGSTVAINGIDHNGERNKEKKRETLPSPMCRSAWLPGPRILLPSRKKNLVGRTAYADIRRI
jgi:hypothetical protein